MYLYKKKNW